MTYLENSFKDNLHFSQGNLKLIKLMLFYLINEHTPLLFLISFNNIFQYFYCQNYKIRKEIMIQENLNINSKRTNYSKKNTAANSDNDLEINIKLEAQLKLFTSNFRKIIDELWEKSHSSLLQIKKIYQQKITYKQMALSELSSQNQKMKQCFSTLNQAAQSFFEIDSIKNKKPESLDTLNLIAQSFDDPINYQSVKLTKQVIQQPAKQLKNSPLNERICQNINKSDPLPTKDSQITFFRKQKQVNSPLSKHYSNIKLERKKKLKKKSKLKALGQIIVISQSEFEQQNQNDNCATVQISNERHNNQSNSKTDPIQLSSILQQKTLSKIQTSFRDNSLIQKISLTPNKTEINYVQYNLSDKFRTNKTIQFTTNKFQLYFCNDLSLIQSVKLGGLQINDNSFQFLCQLKLPNLISLVIDQNHITDISPLKNFNLRKFVELDISWNKLGKQSAEFTAYQQFPSLIYLTLSFEQNYNEAAWQVILQNRLQNYPNLQYLEIVNSNQLSQSSKQEIDKIIDEKTQILGFKIKTLFLRSIGDWIQEQNKILKKQNRDWIKQMKYKNQPYFQKKNNQNYQKKSSKKSKRIRKLIAKTDFSKTIHQNKNKTNKVEKYQKNQLSCEVAQLPFAREYYNEEELFKKPQISNQLVILPNNFNKLPKIKSIPLQNKEFPPKPSEENIKIFQQNQLISLFQSLQQPLQNNNGSMRNYFSNSSSIENNINHLASEQFEKNQSQNIKNQIQNYINPSSIFQEQIFKDNLIFYQKQETKQIKEIVQCRFKKNHTNYSNNNDKQIQQGQIK